MKPKLQYISHGISLTGGYYHESTLAQTLAQQIHGEAAHYSEVRFNRIFKGPVGWLLLFFKAFFAADSNAHIITVARLAWPIRLKQLFGKGKMLLVLHNYDANDGKPALYYRLLNTFLRHSVKHSNHIRLVVVARCWQQFMHDKFGIKATHFPNLFHTEKYTFLKETTKKNPKLIHFGQYSEKIDKKKYLLLFHKLKTKGFVCYFSSSAAPFSSHFPISFFNTHDAYLKQMAGSAVSIIQNSVNEGWDRVAFESLLLGTTIIVSPGGGNEEMANQFGGAVCKEVDEIVALVEQANFKMVQTSLDDYHVNKAPIWAKPLFNFMQS